MVHIGILLKIKKINYHKDKTDKCEKLGIRLIHIFEHEWMDQRKRNILTKHIFKLIDSSSVNNIASADLEIANLDKRLAKQFNELYHLQGGVTAPINIGCFYNNKLYGVLSAGPVRSGNKDAEFEIYRICWHPDYKVTNGTEALINKFKQLYKPRSIIVYVDRSKFSGESYRKSGFKLMNIGEPNYCYVKDHTFEVVNRYKATKQALVEKGWGTPEQSESEIMDAHGYYKIYDSGNAKYIWKELDGEW